MARLVFDFGGVLFDWHPPSLLRRALPHRAVDDASARHWAQLFFQGPGGDWDDYDRGTVEPPLLVQRIARRTGLAPAEVQAVVDGVAGELQPRPASVALLARLRDAGHRLYFLSNMSAHDADRLQALHAFVGWFDDGVFSARVGAVKPEPAIFALAAGRFGAAPAELLLVDDHLPNVVAARAAGWQAELFAGVPALEERLRTLRLPA